MELIPSETSLVVAGAWNMAILTPAWIQKHGLLKTDERVQVLIPTTMGGMVDFPRYTIGDIQYQVRPDWLQVSAVTASSHSLERIESFIRNILAELPHTPVTGVGHNFTLVERRPSAELLSRFTNANLDISDKLDQNLEVASSSISVTIANPPKTILTNINRTFEAGIVTIKVNVHHPITDVDRVQAILSGVDGYRKMDDSLLVVESLLVDSKEVTA